MTTSKPLKPLNQNNFKDVYEAMNYCFKNKIWGTVTIVKEGDFYVIHSKTE